ncbi:hypothetical protein GZH47_01245 [Paenibacillus rhizovicinus]|uniref:Uncharacterized protein n=1 Tax=Paenibacillus rhizovicinus TaxID=2704463 RepID=A0A6C0NYP2_9BACL|nr:hypothetical protein [Paenibacillus rhizovicinus]QHW29592.1 hypothetical protein GZH47_01245 [Paenibacillus rhizovicinus]
MASLNSRVKGAVMGASMTGGWLLADLLLPEPWGDVVLYAAMAVVNVGIGWRLGKFYDKQSDKETAADFDAKKAANYELPS